MKKQEIYLNTIQVFVGIFDHFSSNFYMIDERISRPFSIILLGILTYVGRYILLMNLARCHLQVRVYFCQ